MLYITDELHDQVFPFPRTFLYWPDKRSHTKVMICSAPGRGDWMEINPCLFCCQRLYYPQVDRNLHGAPRSDMHFRLTLVTCRTAVRHHDALAMEGAILMGWVISSVGKEHSTDEQKQKGADKRKGICILFIECCASSRVTATPFPFNFSISVWSQPMQMLFHASGV